MPSEAAIGIEPINNGFANRPLNHLGTPPFQLRSVASIEQYWSQD